MIENQKCERSEKSVFIELNRKTSRATAKKCSNQSPMRKVIYFYTLAQIQPKENPTLNCVGLIQTMIIVFDRYRLKWHLLKTL